MKQKTILAKIVSWVSVWILLFSNIFCVIPETVRASNVFSTYNDAYAETGGWLDFGAFTVTETEILQDSTGTGSNASTFHADATYYTKVHEIGLEAALSGWAWSDDIGWIQMSVNTLSDNTQTGATITASASQSASNYGVYIDANGYFRGYAWSETAGWVSFYDGISSTSYTATTWRAFYTVTLLSPAEDARIDTNSLVLSFDLDDFEGDALKFQIQVGTDAEVSTWSRVIDFTELSTQATPRNAVEYTAVGLSSGKYYWRVRAIDEGGSEEEWSTISSFTVDLDLPESTILYPQDGADLSKVNLIRGESTDNDGIDFTRISIYDITAKKYFNGTGFTVDLETWLTTTPAGGWRPKVNWHYIAPTWSEGHSYTIRSRATDTAGNEEHTDAITFTYDTVNWEEGSIYVSNPAVMTNSNYKIYYPNTLTVPEDSYLEVDFDDTFAFSPWLENSDVTLTDVGGGISASVATFDRENKIIRSTINTGSVWVNDLIELSVNNLKIHNPSATGSYVLPIVIYDSVGAEIEAGTGMITLDYPYQQVQLNVNIEESLQLGVDSGSVLIEVDPDDQLGQNWSGTGGEVSEKTAVEVKTNAQSGYNLMISLSGKTATGSAVLDGRTLTGSQITSTAGDRVDLENNFTFVLNSSGSTSVTDFKNTTTQIIWAGTSGATNGYIDNIFYYLNVDHTIPADSYEGTIVYTAIRQL